MEPMTPTVLPLSLSQQNIWALEQACPGTSINHICTTLYLQGTVDLSALQRSIHLVLAADPSLNTRITLRDGVPMQYEAPYQPAPIPVYDFSLGEEEGADRWVESFAREPLSLLDAPLCRFVLLRTGEDRCRLVVKMHHLISDGWTQTLLCNRVGQAYLDLLAGREPSLDAIPSYAGHVEEEQRYLASPSLAKDEAYWREVLSRPSTPASLKPGCGTAISPVGRRISVQLPQDVSSSLSAFCLKNRVSPFSVFYMALAIYLQRLGMGNSFTIGVPIYNRLNFRSKQTSGMFVSTLPFVGEVNGDWTFEEFSRHLGDAWYGLLRHQRCPFSRIQQLAREQGGDGQRLFHIALSYQNSQLLSPQDAPVDFSGRWHYSGYQMEQLCIHLSDLSGQGQYLVDYDYLTQLFTPGEIQSLHSCLVHLLRQALAQPDRPISQLSLLTPPQEEQVVYAFNASRRPLDPEGLYARFARCVEQFPHRVALIQDQEAVTYRQLEEQAARFHAALSSLCTQPDTLIALLLPRSPRLFAAMMGVLRAGGAFLLLSPDLPQGRVRTILEQSQAAALVAPPALAAPYASLLPTVDPDQLPPPTQEPPCSPSGADLAYVVYTSGSTGQPKGVEIPRRALLNLAQAMEGVYGGGAVLSLCSVGFDAFLLESAAALLNARTIVLPQDRELESPRDLARLIADRGVGFLSTTPSRLAAYLAQPDFARAAACLDTLLCGGEPFPGDLLRRLKDCTRARIFNQYGPSETTVAVSLKELNHASRITAGKPMDNCRLYVLDPWAKSLPAGVFGELYIGGPCVGRGYRNAPQLTAQSFLDSPFVPGDRLYRTGDRACWTAEGELVLGGRLDSQIKLRGLRIEPQEVAACLNRHPQVSQAVATVQNVGGQEALVAFYTAPEPIPEEELLALCANDLPAYMVPAAVARLDAIPLTPNGKADPARLPQLTPDPQSQSQWEGPLLTQVVDILRRVLDREDLEADSDYFLYGGNSLNAMQALSELADATGQALRVRDLYACRTPRRLCALLQRQGGEIARHLTPAPAQERWPLTPIQQGIYVQSHLDSTGRTYLMPAAFRLGTTPDIPRLEEAFRTLIAQEPMLRTAFALESDGIFARVRPQVDFHLDVRPAGGDLTAAAAPILAPFQLDQPPLLRAGLWEELPGRWVLLLNVHHMVADGLTTPILLQRLDRIYQGETLPEQTLTYLDYAWYLDRHAHDPGQLDYWTGRLVQLPEPLELPCDFARTQTFDYQGRTRVHRLDRELSQACDDFCAQAGVSPYMLFLAAFGLLLSRLSGKEDLLVGAAAAGRMLPETREMCGPFINTLPLRLRPQGQLTLKEYLDALREEVNGMLDHQQVGLEEIVSALDLPRTLTQSPLFQVIFSQRPVDAGSFTLGGAPLEYLPTPSGSARMELWVELFRDGEGYGLQLEYATQLFLDETAAYFGRCLETLVRSILSAGETPLEELEALSPQDRTNLIEIPNHTVSPFVNLPVPALFQRQLELDPNAPAVIFHGEATTRRALDRRACQLANLLKAQGAQPGTRVGIALSRGVDLVAAVLAIWKLGAAYSPLLAHYPAQRLKYMVDVAGITHILCDVRTREQLPQDLPCTLVSTQGTAEERFVSAPLHETDLAEVLFTSGSTGQPKGVMLAWRSMANMVSAFRKILEQSDGPILCTTNVVFDMFNGEVVIPLSMGKPIVMADEEEMMLPWKLAQLIERHGVRITQSTPSRVQMWFSNEAFCRVSSNLELMIYGGEVLTKTLLRTAQTHSGAKQVNMYGPTEGTVYNTTRSADFRAHVNVGWPMDNNRLYVLDEKLRPVLPTAAGELYLAGECVSQGYISRPELTQASFLPDPFFPGERMYRTGDIARLRLDGSYDFLGRWDAQVKLNGQRVELDEINGAMVSQGCALQAATVPVRREDGSMELFTYYIPPQVPLELGEMRRLLGQVLPAYMIPSHLIPLESMPSTPTGKISLRQLGKMAQAGENTQTADAQPEAAPEKPTQEQPAQPDPTPLEGEPGSLEWILSLWRRVLSRREVDADVSFFEQGGTSLAALSVLSHYNNSRLILSLAQFYEHPTPRAQADLLAAQQPRHPQPQESEARTLISAPAAQLSRRVPALPQPPHSGPMDTVLLTGATGFLGAHILQALLEAGTGTILCAMRDGSRRRLEDTLSWYFGAGWVMDAEDRLEVIQADLDQPMLGLSQEAFQALAQRVDAVWHCAADVRHYAADSDALLRTNLEGTRTLVKLSLAGNARLYHMSTTSVSGDHLVGREDRAVFTEEEFDLGQNWRENLYVRSKFLAEDAVYQGIRQGLTARVFRLGRLVGRAVDGLFQKNPQTNAFWLTARGVHALGAIPQSLAALPMDLTPVDWCARAAVALRESPLTAYHLESPQPPTAEQAFRAVAPDLLVLSDEEFDHLLRQAPLDLQSSVLAPVTELWNRLRSAPAAITVDCARTQTQLAQVGFQEAIPAPRQLLRSFRFEGANL